MQIPAQFVDRIQKQSTCQRKIPLPKKFWEEFALGSLVKITRVDDPSLFFVDRVQAQGKVQRKIPLPQKFWEFFEVNSFVSVELMKRE